MNDEKNLEVNEQNKMVEEEQPVVFVPDYNKEFKPVEPVKMEEEIEEVEIPNYSEEVQPVESIFVTPEATEEVEIPNYSEEVQPVVMEEPVEPTVPNYSAAVEPVKPVEQETELSDEEKAVLREKLSHEVILEHPDAKIVLNREEPKIESRNIDNDKVTKNESLKFVLILGIVLLVVIFAIPYLSKFFQL